MHIGRRFDGKAYDVDRFIVHAQYARDPPAHNIALVRTQLPIEMDAVNVPVTLPTPTADYTAAGDRLMAAIGIYDTFSVLGYWAHESLWANWPSYVKPDGCCLRMWNAKQARAAEHLCTVQKPPETTDYKAGNPLLIRSEAGEITLIGIRSWWDHDAPVLNEVSGLVPDGGWTRVQFYVPWIEANTRV